MNTSIWPSGWFPHSHRRTRALKMSQPGPIAAQRVALFLAMALLALLGLLQLNTPGVVPATAPATAFSAERAMTHLEVIAAESRAIGLPGHDATRDYLFAELTAMGLAPELQVATGVVRFDGADAFEAGQVTNVVARIPGTASTGAIALNAHYDGGSTGPAASDNGSGVVTVLETVRAILAGPALANDIIVVFTDGEENGDIGAAAFTQEHPWAAGVRLAINFEAQGSGGPVLLYATGTDDGWVTAEYFDAAPHASGYSLLPELVRLLPGMRLACDLEDYLLTGAAGLGFVYASDTAAYHTVRDSVATIERGSIQQEGENTLAAVRHFGALDLASIPRDGNRVFFNIFPGVVVHYAESWVLPLAALISAGVLAIAVAGVRRGVLSVRGIAGGLLVNVVGLLLTVVAVILLWSGIRLINDDLRVLLVGSYQSTLYYLVLTLAAIAVMSALLALARRWLRLENLAAGAVVAWLLAMWGVSLTAPAASYLLAWPLAAAVLPLAWAVMRRERGGSSWTRVAVLAVAMVPAIVLLPGTWYQVGALFNRLDFFSSVSGSVSLLGVWALFVAPLVGLALFQVDALSGARARGKWLVPVVTGLAAVLLVGWSLASSGFDAGHPRPDHVAYDLDLDTGVAQWVSIDESLDPWTAQFFPDDATRAPYEIADATTVDAWMTPAPVAAVPAVDLTVVADTTTDGVRTITFRTTSPREAAELDMEIVARGEVTAAAIDGRSLDLAGYTPAREGELRFSYAAPGLAGIEVTISVRSTEPLAIQVRETRYGFPDVPGMTIEERPAGYMPASGFPLDPTIVRRSFTV